MADSGPVAVVVLAAGGSSRLGYPKQLATVSGETLLRRAAKEACASSCRPVVVVLGAAGEVARRELDGLAATIVDNDRWARGIGSSIAVGIAAVGDARAAIVMLCDQVGVGARDLEALVAAYREGSGPVVAAHYSGVVGPPALFDRSLFDELSRLDGDVGARRIIARQGPAFSIAMPHAAVDVDTPEDLARLSGQRGKEGARPPP